LNTFFTLILFLIITALILFLIITALILFLIGVCLHVHVFPSSKSQSYLVKAVIIRNRIKAVIIRTNNDHTLGMLKR
jgi:hypothetical protein